MNSKERLIAASMVTVLGVGGLAINSASKDKQTIPTEHLEEIVRNGDGFSNIAERMIKDSDGHIKLTVEQVEPFIHTADIPMRGDAEHPRQDDVNAGELAQADIPLHK